MDYLQAGDQVITVNNRSNPGGIEATLRRWFEDKSVPRDKWIVFDGVTVMLVDNLLSCPHRSLGPVSDCASLFGENAHLTLTEFLYNDF